MRKNIERFSGVLLVVLVLCVVACKKEDVSNEEKVDSSKKNLTNFLNEIYFDEIKPKNEELSTNVTELGDLFDNYSMSPSNENLEKVKEQWLKTAITATEAKTFNISPIERRFFFTRIYGSPVSSFFISEGKQEFKNRVGMVGVSALPNSYKGLASVEYFLFESDSLETYTALVKGLMDDLSTTSLELENKWVELETDFVSGETITINSGYGELINGFVSVIELSKKNRFDQPFGLNTMGDYQFEAERSGQSANLFATSFNYLRKVLETYHVPLLELQCEKDLALSLINQVDSLNESINQLTNAGRTKFKDINSSVSENELKLVQENLKELLMLVKIEMSNLYDTKITFTAADGD